MNLFNCIYIFTLFFGGIKTEYVRDNTPPVKVNKCCEENEIYVGKYCTAVERTQRWFPLFSTETEANIQVNYILATGSPDCGSMQPWSIYHYKNSTDRLRLLPTGVLRHLFDNQIPGEEEELEEEYINGKDLLFHDYVQGKYCLDKKKDDNFVSEFAWVCAPDHTKEWMKSTAFLMRNIVNPVTHGIGIICLLITAIIYFVMPTLRDLNGNIITTICLCLIFSQIGDMIRLLTVFKSHISLIIAETVCYLFLLGAFFWLNSLGYYIWKTFKSRNVFLRITDGKKYCYYSAYVWSCTIVFGTLAIFAHFTMDYPEPKASIQNLEDQREEFGSLGMIIFFLPVAGIILINVFFIATTLKTINRMHTYGRIHHKLKHSFRLSLLMLLTMCVCWMFFLSSFSKYDGLINGYIVANSFQGPLILYICVFNQKHVSYLIRKTCCYKNCICSCCRPEPESEWGDEMTAMNTGSY